MGINAVFPNVGTTIRKNIAIQRLKTYYLNLSPNDPYALKKALGALGGGTVNGLIDYRNGYFVRIA